MKRRTRSAARQTLNLDSEHGPFLRNGQRGCELGLIVRERSAVLTALGQQVTQKDLPIDVLRSEAQRLFDDLHRPTELPLFSQNLRELEVRGHESPPRHVVGDVTQLRKSILKGRHSRGGSDQLILALGFQEQG